MYLVWILKADLHVVIMTLPIKKEGTKIVSQDFLVDETNL